MQCSQVEFGVLARHISAITAHWPDIRANAGSGSVDVCLRRLPYLLDPRTQPNSEEFAALCLRVMLFRTSHAIITEDTIWDLIAVFGAILSQRHTRVLRSKSSWGVACAGYGGFSPAFALVLL